VARDKDDGLLDCMLAQTEVLASTLVGEGYQLPAGSLLTLLFLS
jgi:hypothetical protein